MNNEIANYFPSSASTITYADSPKQPTIPGSLVATLFKGQKIKPTMSHPVEPKDLDELNLNAWVDADLNREFNRTAPGYAKRCVKLKKLRTRARRKIRAQVAASLRLT